MHKTFPLGCRAEIVTLNCTETVAAWYKRQNSKPLAVFNASLYAWNAKDKKMLPVGIVFEGGRLICGEGNGLGFGYAAGGPWEFATSWAKRWDDYITGYALVQGGAAVPNPAVYYGDDRNLYEGRHTRIAVGRDNRGRLMVIASDKAMTLVEFKVYCLSVGAVDAINLDGGGSRHLIYDGSAVISSPRTPYNIIAIYGETEKREENPMKVKCTKKTSTYTADGKLETNRYIDAGDICTITPEVNANLVIPITYPSGSTTRAAYIKDLANFLQA